MTTNVGVTSVFCLALVCGLAYADGKQNSPSHSSSGPSHSSSGPSRSGGSSRGGGSSHSSWSSHSSASSHSSGPSRTTSGGWRSHESSGSDSRPSRFGGDSATSHGSESNRSSDDWGSGLSHLGGYRSHSFDRGPSSSSQVDRGPTQSSQGDRGQSGPTRTDRQGDGRPSNNGGRPSYTEHAGYHGGRNQTGNTTSQYGQSNNNHFDANRAGNMSIGRVPVVPRGGNFESHILRSETVRRGDGWRTGYFGYNRGFRDSSFFFGFYAFDPFLEPCVISPWYYYSYLPGYISPGRVFYLSFAPVYYHWSSYYWQPPYFYDDGYADGYNAGYNSGSRNADDNNNGGVSTDQGVFVDNSKSGPRDPLLDAAINDLIRVYQRKDGGALDDILPANDRVNIYTDDHYDYSVNPADFSALVLDAAQQAHTVRFEITGVSIDGANAKVVALHTFEDASGKRQTVVQTYRFSRQDGRMVVVEFGTSQK